MNQYEVGKRTPDYPTLKRIAKVLGYSPAYFYTEDGLLGGGLMLGAGEDGSG